MAFIIPEPLALAWLKTRKRFPPIALAWNLAYSYGVCMVFCNEYIVSNSLYLYGQVSRWSRRLRWSPGRLVHSRWSTRVAESQLALVPLASCLTLSGSATRRSFVAGPTKRYCGKQVKPGMYRPEPYTLPRLPSILHVHGPT